MATQTQTVKQLFKTLPTTFDQIGAANLVGSTYFSFKFTFRVHFLPLLSFLALLSRRQENSSEYTPLNRSQNDKFFFCRFKSSNLNCFLSANLATISPRNAQADVRFQNAGRDLRALEGSRLLEVLVCESSSRSSRLNQWRGSFRNRTGQVRNVVHQGDALLLTERVLRKQMQFLGKFKGYNFV